MRLQRHEKILLDLMTVDKFSKSKFDRFVKVQKKGGFNMIDSRVQLKANIDIVDHHFILSNYDELYSKWYDNKS